MSTENSSCRSGSSLPRNSRRSGRTTNSSIRRARRSNQSRCTANGSTRRQYAAESTNSDAAGRLAAADLSPSGRPCSGLPPSGRPIMHWFQDLRIRWKVLLAPALLIVVIVALSAYALYVLRANQRAIQELVAGPIQHAELVSDFSSLVWAAHVRLYRLTA